MYCKKKITRFFINIKKGGPIVLGKKESKSVISFCYHKKGEKPLFLDF